MNRMVWQMRKIIFLAIMILFCPVDILAESVLEYTRTVYIGANAAKVWDALVNPEIVNKYYLAPLAKIELKKGGEIYYGSEKHKMISGVVKEAIPNEKLVHTFKFAHRSKEPSSTVSYAIHEMGEMCALTLKHDGFVSKEGTYQDITFGWETILSSLKTLLETGKTLPWPKPEKK